MQSNQSVVKASGGKAGGQQINSSSSHMGSNRNMQNIQNKSRLSSNDVVPDDDSSEDDQLNEEPPDMRVYPEFLKNLPGVQASDSMGYRIEALRVYLENQLTDRVFIAAY